MESAHTATAGNCPVIQSQPIPESHKSQFRQHPNNPAPAPPGPRLPDNWAMVTRPLGRPQPPPGKNRPIAANPLNPQLPLLTVTTTYDHFSGHSHNIQDATCHILKHAVQYLRTYIREPRVASRRLFHERPLPTYPTGPPRHEARQERMRASATLVAATVEQPGSDDNQRVSTCPKHLAKA